MEYITLNNGVKIPQLGFGVYQVPKEECQRCVLDAIKAGYRHIDTAQSYFNEAEVGDAVSKCGVPREDLFITSKVWIDNYGYEKTRKSVLAGIEKLKSGYIDLMLLHQPFADYYGAYRALENLYKEGKIRAIGVSNFAPDRLADIAQFNEIKPAVDQVEINVFNQQKTALDNMEKRGIHAEAWAPFGEGKNGMFTNPTLTAIAAAHKKSVAQVILRWLVQRGVIALAKSLRADRMAENIAVFDFELTAAEMEEIAALDTGKSLFFDHRAPETVDWFADLIVKRRQLL